jgi:hypothetical protein
MKTLGGGENKMDKFFPSFIAPRAVKSKDFEHLENK